jgi:hypothetical protein
MRYLGIEHREFVNETCSGATTSSLTGGWQPRAASTCVRSSTR